MTTNSDPKILTCKVGISYRSDDGFSTENVFKIRAIDHNVKMPEQPLLDGLRELARLTALFGFEEQAKDVFDEAQKRVAEWKVATGRKP